MEYDLWFYQKRQYAYYRILPFYYEYLLNPYWICRAGMDHTIAAISAHL